MTNEEKAREIADNAKKQQYFDSRCNDLAGSVGFMSAMVMAEWKDHQFKEYLEKKITEYNESADKWLHTKNMERFCVTPKIRMDTIKSIIKEFFKED